MKFWEMSLFNRHVHTGIAQSPDTSAPAEMDFDGY